MARTVLVVTDRPMFAGTCQPLLASVGARASVIAPSDIGGALKPDDAAIFDGDCDAYREQDDELLVALGLARALRVTAALACSSPRATDIDDLAAELCPGLVARATAELTAVVTRLAKRADGRAVPRFEYVTVSPRDAELLVILSNGDAMVVARPCADDDGSEVTSIDLAADAASATLALSSGASFVLRVDAVVPRSHAHATNGVSALDSATVGSRLRELRKAAGLTQAELARRTNIHRPNIARVEAGRHTPSLDTLARIADAIGVPVTRVLSAD